MCIRDRRCDHHAVGRVDGGEEPGAAPGREHRDLLALRRHRLELPVPAAVHREVSGGVAADHAHQAEHGHHRNYVAIWGILVALLVVSVVGPMTGIRVIMLLTAFGVACVKAYMVAKNFMHLDVEKTIIHWMMILGVTLMVLFF